MWDERLSTAAVERALIEADVSRAKRKAVIDQHAAAYILQGALDRLGQEPGRQTHDRAATRSPAALITKTPSSNGIFSLGRLGGGEFQ